MNIIAIDPGTRNTGVVYLNKRGILCAKTIQFKQKIWQDQDALLLRAKEIARQLSDWIADKPHEAIVIEGFVYQSRNKSSNIYQTPYICGYLQSLLSEENLVIQTSPQVLAKKDYKLLMEEFAQKVCEIPGSYQISNEHLRSAASHGWYYLMEGCKNGREL